MDGFGRLAAATAVVVALATGCTAATATSRDPVLRLGYLPQVTHAPGIAALETGAFASALGDDATVEATTFATGTTAIEALFSGAIDAAYLGPNPAINGWAQSDGAALRIVAGSTSGGASLVVREGITSADDLMGTVLASPSLGNTQDVALRAWLAREGIATDRVGGGDVQVLPQDNAQSLETFTSGDIDGAWVPEPWATRMVREGGGIVLVDERDLWPGGEFVTTHLVVSAAFLDTHPDLVRRLLEGHVAAIDALTSNPQAARELVNDHIESVTGRRLADEVLEVSWAHLTFTVDPVAASLQASADNATAVGLLDPVDLEGIYALDILNELLAELDRDPAEGLGQ